MSAIAVAAAAALLSKEAEPDVEEEQRTRRQSIEDARLAEALFIAGTVFNCLQHSLTPLVFLGRPRVEDFSGSSRSYVQLGDLVHKNITTKPEFEAFFQIMIGIMCVLMGIETYLTEEGHPAVDGLMLLLVVFFTLEVLLKIVAESTKPWRYFFGPSGSWNTLDLIIVILCMPFVKNNTIGRIMRMIRLGKVVSTVPQFRVFVFGIIKAGQDILNVSALIILILYMYAIAGVTLFQHNDPERFGSFHASFMTLFSLSTMDNWAYVMHFNMYGCAAFDDACTSSEGNTFVSFFFFMTFVVITGLVMLSMFIGVISIAMTSLIVELKDDRLASQKEEATIRKQKALEELEKKPDGHKRFTRGQSTRQMNKHLRVMALVKSVLDNVTVNPVVITETTFFGKAIHKAAVMAGSIVESTGFRYLIYTLVGGGGLLVGLKCYLPEITPVTNAFGLLMTSVFTIEMLLKIIACEFEPWHYFYCDGAVQAWNVLDSSVVVGSFLPGIPGDLMMVFRMLLVLKIMQRHPGLRVSVVSFLAAMGEVGSIGALMAIVIFFFSIVGNTFFGINDPGHFGNLHSAMLTLFRVATLSSWTEGTVTTPAPASFSPTHCLLPSSLRSTQHQHVRLREVHRLPASTRSPAV
jgi:voltage-gated sodium channel